MSQSLLQTQKNKVFEIITKYDLDPTEFQWITIESIFIPTDVSALVHKPSEYFYKFDINRYEKQYGIYSPADGQKQTRQYVGDWHSQLNHVNIWVEILKKELDAPDLWEIATNTKDLVKHDFEDEDDSKFTSKEISIIEEKLEELYDYIIKTSNLNTEQIAFLNSRIDYLKSSSERVTKKDWKIILIGVLFNIIVGLGLKAAIANDIMAIASQLFSEFYTKLLIN